MKVIFTYGKITCVIITLMMALPGSSIGQHSLTVVFDDSYRTCIASGCGMSSATLKIGATTYGLGDVSFGSVTLNVAGDMSGQFFELGMRYSCAGEDVCQQNANGLLPATCLSQVFYWGTITHHFEPVISAPGSSEDPCDNAITLTISTDGTFKGWEVSKPNGDWTPILNSNLSKIFSVPRTELEEMFGNVYGVPLTFRAIIEACTIYESGTLTFTFSPPPPEADIEVISPTCPGGSDGQIALNHMNLFPNTLSYNYTITQYVNEPPGGCPPDLIGEFASPDGYCPGARLSLSNTEGISDFTISQNNVGNELSLTAGHYGVLITAQTVVGESCKSIHHVTIMDPPPITIVQDGLPVSPSCVGGNDGVASFEIGSGNGNSGYLITSAEGINVVVNSRSFALSGLAHNQVHNKILEVRDLACPGNDATTIVSLPEGNVAFALDSLADVTDPTCFSPGGIGNGSFKVHVRQISGYQFGYNYKLYDSEGLLHQTKSGGIEMDFHGLSPEVEYSVSVRSPNNCLLASPQVLLKPPPALSGNVIENDNICNGAATGKIQFHQTTGSGQLSFLLTNLNSGTEEQNHTGIFGAVEDGVYRLKVTDQCLTHSFHQQDSIVFQSIQITSPPPLLFLTGEPFLANNSTLEIACSSDTQIIQFAFENAIPPFSVRHINNAVMRQLQASQSQSIETSQGTNQYIQVQDQCSSISLEFDIISRATSEISATIKLLQYSGGNHITCNGVADGRAELTVHGGVPGPPGDRYHIQLMAQNGLIVSESGSGNITELSVNGDSTKYLLTGLAPAQQYSLRVTDRNTPLPCAKDYLNVISGLIEPDPLAIGQPGSADLTGIMILQGKPFVICAGDSTAEISVNISGGNVPYDIRLSDESLPNGPLIRRRVTDNYSGDIHFEQLGAALYTISVEDKFGCDSQARSIEIFESESPLRIVGIASQTYANGANTSCYSRNDGKISLSVSGGTGSYTYYLSDEFGSIDTSYVCAFENLAATGVNTQSTRYKAIVQDQLGCISPKNPVDQPEIELVAADSLSLKSRFLTPHNNLHQILCKGDSAHISVTTSNGAFPHTVRIGNSDHILHFQGDTSRIYLRSGSYAVNIIDNLGCSLQVDSISVNEPDTHVQVLIDSVKYPDCIGGDGIIYLSARGGTSDGTYLFSVNDRDEFIKATKAAFSRGANAVGSSEYRSIVKDHYGCSDQLVVTMPEDPTPLTLTIEDIIQPSCYGASDGFIRVKSENYTSVNEQVLYHITGGSFSDTLSVWSSPHEYVFHGLEATDVEGNMPYTVWVDDAHYCKQMVLQFHEGINIISPEKIKISSEVTSPGCIGQSNGSIAVHIEGGVPPYRYTFGASQYQPVNTDSLFLGSLDAGTYVLRLRDALFKDSLLYCEVDTTLIVHEGRKVVLTAEIKRVSCIGGDDGVIELQPSVQYETPDPPGTFDYQYQWSKPGSGKSFSENQDIYGLSSGLYTLNVVYNFQNGTCKKEQSFGVPQPAAKLAISSVKTFPASCGVDNDGRALVAIIGGWQNVPVYYQLDSGQWYKITGDLLMLNSLRTGSHQLQLRQGNCQASETFSITMSHPVLGIDALEKPSCPGYSDGTVVLSRPFEQSEYILGTRDAIEVVQGLPIFSQVSAGEYFAKAVDVKRPVCHTDWIYFTMSDPLDCGDGSLRVSVLEIDSATCNVSNDGAARLLARGGTPPYKYFWDNSATPSTSENLNLKPGDHIVKIVDATGSAASTTFNMPSMRPLEVIVSVTSASCEAQCDGGAFVHIVGGSGKYLVDVNDQQSQVSVGNLCVGSYRYRIRDRNNDLCVVAGEFPISSEPELKVTIDEIKSPRCQDGLDGAIAIAVTGGSGSYNYAWSNGVTSQDISNVSAGHYNLVVTDVETDCSVRDDYEIASPKPIEVSNLLLTPPKCFGGDDGKIEISVNNVRSKALVTWNNGSIGYSLINLAAGTYQYQITTEDGCSANGSIILPDASILKTDLLTQTPTCHGKCDGELKLLARGGATPYYITWDDGSHFPDRKNLCAGIYSYTLRDRNGCTVHGSKEINEVTPLSVNATLNSPTCHRSATGSIDVEVSGGTPPYSFKWNSGAATQSIDSLNSGYYRVSIHDARGCEETGEFRLQDPQPIIVAREFVLNPSCSLKPDGSLGITTRGGIPPYTYLWSNGETTPEIKNLVSGEYSVVIADTRQCSIRRSYSVVSPAAISLGHVDVRNPSCYGEATGSIRFRIAGGAPPYTTIWNTGVATRDLLNVTGGRYIVNVTDFNECQYEKEFTLIEPDPPVINGIPAKLVVCRGSTAFVQPLVDNWRNFQWSGPEGFLSLTRRLETRLEGDYVLQATNADGCSAEASLHVEVSDMPLSVDFLLLSEPVTDLPVTFVDISYPVPDRVEWNAPQGALITQQSDYSVSLTFSTAGEYAIEMTAYAGDCRSTITRRITVDGSQGGRASTAPDVDSAYILLEAFPNPVTSGTLEIRIVTASTDPIKVTLISSTDGRVVASQNFEGRNMYHHTFDSINGPGLYTLVYTQRDVRRYIKLVALR